MLVSALLAMIEYVLCLSLIHFKNAIITQDSRKAGIEIKGCSRKVSIRRGKMFGASAMAFSHAGLHHHSSWIDNAARWARSCLFNPVLLSTWLLSLLDDWFDVGCAFMLLPFLHSSDV